MSCFFFNWSTLSLQFIQSYLLFRSICIWSVFKKKPVCVQRLAHGKSLDGQPNWLISIAASKYTDLVASGSCDGFVRFWKVALDYKNISQLFFFGLVSVALCPR